MATRVLAAIKTFEAQGLNIFVEVQAEEVLQQARASDERHRTGQPLSLFDGVLVAVKVLVDEGELATKTSSSVFLSLFCRATPLASSFLFHCLSLVHYTSRAGHGGDQEPQYV